MKTFQIIIAGLIIIIPAWAEAPLPFDNALAKILERNTTVAIQRNALEATSARNLPVKAAFLPGLSINANQTTTRVDKADSTTTRQAVGTAQLNLFRFGADWAALGAASSDVDAQRALLDSTWLTAETDGVRALVRAIEVHQNIEILARIAQSQELLLRVARQRFDRGLLPQQEVDKLSIDLDNARARLKDAEIQQSAARAALESALGTSEIIPLWPWRERLEREGPKATAEKIELSAIPAWRAARSQYDAEDKRVSRNFRLMLPSLDSSFSWGYTKLASAGTYTPGWTGVLSVSVPLFNRLSNYASYSAQTYVRSSAESTLEQAGRDARAEWLASRDGFEAALATARARDKTLGTSRRLYQDNVRRFQAGRMSANDLVLDQNRLFETERLSVQGWSAAHVAYTRLCHALGRRVMSCATD